MSDDWKPIPVQNYVAHRYMVYQDPAAADEAVHQFDGGRINGIIFRLEVMR